MPTGWGCGWWVQWPRAPHNTPVGGQPTVHHDRAAVCEGHTRVPDTATSATLATNVTVTIAAVLDVVNVRLPRVLRSSIPATTDPATWEVVALRVGLRPCLLQHVQELTPRHATRRRCVARPLLVPVPRTTATTNTAAEVRGTRCGSVALGRTLRGG